MTPKKAKSYLHTCIRLVLYLSPLRTTNFPAYPFRQLLINLQANMRTANFENQGLILRSCLSWTKISNYECVEVFSKTPLNIRDCSFADLLDAS